MTFVLIMVKVSDMMCDNESVGDGAKITWQLVIGDIGEEIHEGIGKVKEARSCTIDDR